MAQDLIPRPDWGVAPSGFGGRGTGMSLDSAFSSAAGTIAAGDAKVIVQRYGLRELTEAWLSDQAGVATRLGYVQQALDVLHDMKPGERNWLIRSFDALSSPVRLAILQDLGMGKPGGTARASAKDLADFESVASPYVAKVMQRHWKGRYERNVYRALARGRRIYGRLDKYYQNQLDDWFERLSPRMTIAVCIALAGE